MVKLQCSDDRLQKVYFTYFAPVILTVLFHAGYINVYNMVKNITALPRSELDLKKEYRLPVTKLRWHYHIENALLNPIYCMKIKVKCMKDRQNMLLLYISSFLSFKHDDLKHHLTKNVSYTFLLKDLAYNAYNSLTTTTYKLKHLEMLTWLCFKVVMVDRGCGSISPLSKAPFHSFDNMTNKYTKHYFVAIFHVKKRHVWLFK